jgi:hypothetical protein
MRAQIIPFGAAATVTGVVCHDIPNNWAGLRLAHLRGGRRIVNDRYLKAGKPKAHMAPMSGGAGRYAVGWAPWAGSCACSPWWAQVSAGGEESISG